MKAFSYQRFSMPEQKKGASIARQSGGASEWVHRHPEYVLDETVSFRDEGRSAFKGENISEGGKLHLFLQMVDGGKIPRDSALIVESFDRLSRLPITEASELFNGIIRRGLTVVFLSPERVLNKELIDKNPFNLIEVLITGIRANEESQTKSRRVKDAVDRRKEATKNGKAILSLCPPWLELKDASYHQIKNRVNVIKWIFEMYLAGDGAYVIARTLNKQKVPTFGKGTTRKKIRISDEWYKLAIIRLLRDKRLIGFCSFNDSPNYYPAVIDPDIFYRAQSRQKRKPVAGRKQSAKAPLNLFKGLTRCGICGGAASRADKERFGYLHQYFCCENGRSGKGCKYISFKNQWIENSFFNLIDSNAFYGSQTDRKEQAELVKVQGELETAIRQRNKFFKLIEDDDNPSKLLVERLKKAENLVEELEAKVDVAKGIDLERLDQSSEFFELKNNLNDWLEDDSRRARIAEYIRSRVEKIVIRYKESDYPAYSVYFKSGNVFTVTILAHGNFGRAQEWEFQVRKGMEIGFKESEMMFSGND